MKYNDLQIDISEEDLRLDDQELFLKIYEDLNNKYEYLPSNQELTEFITREINLARNRTLCLCCDGAGMVGYIKCIGGCNGRGYIE